MGSNFLGEAQTRVSLTGCFQLTNKINELCAKLAEEKDSDKFSALVQELLKLLNEEQDAIKAKVRRNIGWCGGEIQ